MEMTDLRTDDAPLIDDESHIVVTAEATWFRRVFTREKIKVVVFGQLISLLLCGTGVTSQLLVSNYNVAAPTLQLVLNYFLLATVFGAILVYTRTWWEAISQRGWKYAIIAVLDFEGNYILVKAYQYTNMTSVQLLDCLTIPFVMLLSRFVLKTHYVWPQYAGVALCLVGLAAIVIADVITDRNGDDTGSNPALGDGLVVIGACLYAVANVAQERSVRQYGLLEYPAFIGFFGLILSLVQLAILERDEVKQLDWDGGEVGLLVGFAICLFLLYALVPPLLSMSSATLMNLALLTSDFYSLLFGLFLFHYSFSPLYFAAFGITLIGLFIYHRFEEPAPPQPQPGPDGPSYKALSNVSEAVSEA
eukprot:m.244655 g.244655  ORF g.244655 m.244655 type:complete len:362 (+) comp14491_c0_seq1:72-1157(+)